MPRLSCLETPHSLDFVEQGLQLIVVDFYKALETFLGITLELCRDGHTSE